MRKIERLGTDLGWMKNFKLDLQDIGWTGVCLIHVAQDREKWRALVNMLMSPLVA